MRAICPDCGSSHTKKKAIRLTKNGESRRRWDCKECSRRFTTNWQTFENIDKSHLPRILLFDIETTPMTVHVWGLYKQRIPHTNILKEWNILSWAAKWLYDDEIHSDILTSEEAIAGDDKRILKSIWKLLDEANIVIAHNGDRFDLRKLNARFIDNEMVPPTPYKSIDTLKVARREFAFTSYKQDYLTKHFKLEQKLDTNFQLWLDCMDGKQDALDRMAEYNRHDVMGLEDVYLKLRPYIHNHPNLGVLMDQDVCPNCGSDHLIETEAVYLTTANVFPVFRCGDCKTPYIRHKKNNNLINTSFRSVAR